MKLIKFNYPSGNCLKQKQKKVIYIYICKQIANIIQWFNIFALRTYVRKLQH